MWGTPVSLTLIPHAHHAGEERAEAGVGAQGCELEGAPEVLHVALAGLYRFLDVVERVAVVAAAGADAGERGEGRGVARVGGDGPHEQLLGALQVVGRVVEAGVRVQGARVRRVALERLDEVLLG